MITIQTEKLSDMLDELKPLLPIHWKEIALDHENVPLDPDYEQYLLLEEMGIVHVCTARQDKEIIGYFRTFIRNHIHYKSTKFGHVDIYYVHPNHRMNGTGYKLFKFHEDEMRKAGVKKLINMCKMHQDHAHLFKALGYTEIERIFSKVLTEGDE